MANDYEFYPMGLWKPIKHAPVPYNRMSNLEKCVHNARKHGVTYGEYMANKKRYDAKEKGVNYERFC